MFRTVFIVLITVLGPGFVSAALFDSEDGRDELDRIVGGTKAPNGSAPYQVSLRWFGVRHFCGASIITSRVILTAAHCVDRMKPQYFMAIVGTNQLRSGGTPYPIRKFVRHEDYDDQVIKNDIAVLFTLMEMRLGGDVDAVELNHEPVMPGEKLLLTGWGTTSYPGKAPNDLMMLELNAISFEDCQEAHKNINPVFDSQICALTKEGEGACHGDSGGPLVREGRQVGVVSWGIPCAKGKPDVYTKVESFMDWIEKTLANDNADHIKELNMRKSNRHG
ncbi:chymotrypsin-1 [Papilio machaon]|uniref:chymotrypsin-1 n=1 Tax=Papilio machaon TaxID=76193 RepID=UPI001E6657C6|nr:chymotrypsin-1 [Papilio machaon]